MFEVIHVDTNEVCTVYSTKAVKSVGGGYNTLFLMFLNGEWHWVNANKYKPLA